MKFRDILLLGGLVAVLSGSDCAPIVNPDNQKVYKETPIMEVLSDPQKYKDTPITIEGIPQSVTYHGNTGDNTWGTFVMMISDNDKRHLLCFSKDWRNKDKFAKAKAIIESEMNDGDEELVKAKGVINSEGVLELNSLEANSYTINFAD